MVTLPKVVIFCEKNKDYGELNKHFFFLFFTNKLMHISAWVENNL